jgi:hypothetical protein
MDATQPKTCSKCQGVMERGFTLDEGYGRRGPSHWVQGAPKRSFLFGVTFNSPPIPIGTFRCNSCGYLETYARLEFAPR